MKTFNVIFHTNNGGLEAINGVKAETSQEAIQIARGLTHGQGLTFKYCVETDEN